MYANVDFVKLAKEDAETISEEIVANNSTEALLTILYNLCVLEENNIDLTYAQESLYTKIVDSLKNKGVNIPFGINI